jgi:glycerate 2-kinase
MKIVVAFDKFKGSLTAPRACEIVRSALQAARPELEIVVKPMADGGEGTADVLQSALGGEWIFQRVTGPLQAMPATGKFVWINDRKWAVIEMATASGLTLLRPEHRNPLRTTTHGTGELIEAAVKQGAQRILIGVGGSATVDGGVGAAMALGWRFFCRQRTTSKPGWRRVAGNRAHGSSSEPEAAGN